MTGLEFRRKNETLEERVHRVFGRWALQHAEDGMAVLQYDPGDEYQNIEKTYIEPQPDLQRSELTGRYRMGNEAYEKLVAGFKKLDIAGRCLEGHSKNESTLIATLHLRNTHDTPMTHNALFGAAGNEEFAQINDIILNPMMSRLEIIEPAKIPVYDAILSSGGIINALPPEAAANYGIAPDDIARLERIYFPALNKRLRKGVVAHWSLPGTRGKKIGGSFYIKRVTEETASAAKKRFALAVPVPMDVKADGISLEVLEPRAIHTVGDIHAMMEDMARVATKITGVEVVYGLPDETM